MQCSSHCSKVQTCVTFIFQARLVGKLSMVAFSPISPRLTSGFENCLLRLGMAGLGAASNTLNLSGQVYSS